jgi:hypothetical protein
MPVTQIRVLNAMLYFIDTCRISINVDIHNLIIETIRKQM